MASIACLAEQTVDFLESKVVLCPRGILGQCPTIPWESHRYELFTCLCDMLLIFVLNSPKEIQSS